MHSLHVIGMVTDMVLAELACSVAEIEQEHGERRSTRLKVGRTTGKLGRDHAGAQGIHSGEECIASGRATLHGDIIHEDAALVANAVDVWRFTDHQSAMIDARLHPADVITHDEHDIGLRLRWSRRSHLLLRQRRSRYSYRGEAHGKRSCQNSRCARPTERRSTVSLFR